MPLVADVGGNLQAAYIYQLVLFSLWLNVVLMTRTEAGTTSEKVLSFVISYVRLSARF